jgi:hypothetical protein
MQGIALLSFLPSVFRRQEMNSMAVSYICPGCGKQRWQEVRWATQVDKDAKLRLLAQRTPICGVCVLETGSWLYGDDAEYKKELRSVRKTIEGR